MTEAEFREKHMSRLTAEQTAAVEAAEGAVLLLAVPGSGKTTVLVTRLGYLCLVKGASPERTLTVTYTVAATEEMRERFGAKFGSDLAQRAEFRTINGLASLIIGFYSRTYRRTPPVLMESEAEGAALVRQLYREETGEYPDDGTVRDLRSAFTYIKNMLLTQ
ncbi:MAG: UvrD-helicase domain-containing protein, partial [Oscillospiraceae bacterium]|nr:UvrD-helicase domain-containing protein [Oscillospiraceae bacterium]